MTPEQKDALCEYVDGLRAAGRRYDEIAETLEGKVPDEELDQLEEWHRQWKRRQWREQLRQLQELIPLDDTDTVPAGESSGEEWGSVGSRERELVKYLAERLIGTDVAKDGARVRWKPLYSRAVQTGQTWECVKGPGQLAGRKWLHSAVIFRTGGRVDHIEVEARVRRQRLPGGKRSKRLGTVRVAVELEKLELVREQLDHEEISARLAALLQTYLGKSSGIKSGAHLARLTNVTRQAVSARKLLIAEDYYEKTGGRAGFEGLTSAARHRDKVLEESANQN